MGQTTKISKEERSSVALIYTLLFSSLLVLFGLQFKEVIIGPSIGFSGIGAILVALILFFCGIFSAFVHAVASIFFNRFGSLSRAIFNLHPAAIIVAVVLVAVFG